MQHTQNTLLVSVRILPTNVCQCHKDMPSSVGQVCCPICSRLPLLDVMGQSYIGWIKGQKASSSCKYSTVPGKNLLLNSKANCEYASTPGHGYEIIPERLFEWRFWNRGETSRIPDVQSPCHPTVTQEVGVTVTRRQLNWRGRNIIDHVYSVSKDWQLQSVLTN